MVKVFIFWLVQVGKLNIFTRYLTVSKFALVASRKAAKAQCFFGFLDGFAPLSET